ncbi:MAG: Nramp family divalent metal transporter [Planctomycetota bacterium]
MSNSDSEQSAESTQPSPWYRRIGPGLITTCVVIGPGSIMASSSVGANEQYSMLWVVAVAVAFMMLFTTLGAKLGAVADDSPCQLLRKKAGAWLAVAVGISIFFISAAFQSGNNIGAAAAFEAFVDSKTLVAILIVAFNALALAFLFLFQNMYKMLERLMATFVGIMLVCFTVNLIFLKPDLVGIASGFIPSLGKSDEMLPVLGLIGTTFVSGAAFYQAYLVRQKGWKPEDLPSGLLDARMGTSLMFLITVMLMSTAAAGLYTGEKVTLANPVEVASALDATFGSMAKIIFCAGLFCAAYSSFLINSMIGGFMAADGLGLGSKPEERGPKILTAAVLLIGMGVGLAVLLFDFDRTPTLLAAQATTVVVSPLVAGALLWLTSSSDVMGSSKNRPLVLAAGCLGLALLIAIACKTAFVDLPNKFDKYLYPAPTTASALDLTSTENN